jgi:hypothetical protein
MRYGQDFQETTIIAAPDVIDGLFIVPVSQGRTVLGVRATVLEPFGLGVTDIIAGDDQDDDGYIPLRDPLALDPRARDSFYNSVAGTGVYATGKHYRSPARLLVQIPGITDSAGKLRFTVIYSGDAVPPTPFD